MKIYLCVDVNNRFSFEDFKDYALQTATEGNLVFVFTEDTINKK